MRRLIPSIPPAQRVHRDHDSNPGRIYTPKRQTVAGGRMAKLERTESEITGMIPLCEDNDEHDQMDEVEMDDEVEHGRTAIDDQHPGDPVIPLLRSGQQQQQARLGHQAKEEGRRIFIDIEKRQQRKDGIFLY